MIFLIFLSIRAILFLIDNSWIKIYLIEILILLYYQLFWGKKTTIQNDCSLRSQKMTVETKMVEQTTPNSIFDSFIVDLK